jgi:hypothetical protein
MKTQEKIKRQEAKKKTTDGYMYNKIMKTEQTEHSSNVTKKSILKRTGCK